MLSLFQSHQHHRLYNAIHIFLGELRKDRRGRSGLTDERFEVCDSFRAETFCGKRNLNPLFHNFTRDHRYLHLDLCEVHYLRERVRSHSNSRIRFSAQGYRHSHSHNSRDCFVNRTVGFALSVGSALEISAVWDPAGTVVQPRPKVELR